MADNVLLYKRLLFGFMVILALAPVYGQRKRNTYNNPKQIQKLMAAHRVPALGVAIIKKGKLKHVYVYGELREGIAAPTDAVFNVASLTKPVVAMLTLKLVEKDSWDLDEPLAKYWVDPDVQGDPRHKLLTTRHVLSHRTGFPNWRSGRLAFAFTPGSQVSYSGEGLEYLRRALEKKFGKTLEQLSDSLLFAPLGMSDTRYWWDGGMVDIKFAVGHDASGQPLPVKKESKANAADDLLTTITDYGKFASAILKQKQWSRQTYTSIVHPYDKTASEIYMGLGWEIDAKLPKGEYALIHCGRDKGVRCLVVLLPKQKEGIVLLTNSDAGENLYEHLLSDNISFGTILYSHKKELFHLE